MKNLVAACLLVLAAPAAMAQAPAPGAAPGAAPSQNDMLKMMHLGAHNQLGVLEYCQAQGAIGPDVVAIQKRMLGMLPPAQVDGLPAAEDAGRKGTVQFGGTSMVLADAAKQQNTTVDAMCKKMGEMMQTQAAQLPK